MKQPFTLSRRDFILLGGAATASVLTGCITNPVTGRSQLMLVSEQQEIEIDRSSAPHQFSADYGPAQNAALNAYVEEVGRSIVGVSHRQQLPYSFRALNAVHVNAYTFPAGSVGVTRGILLSMQEESELAALLGHEVAHVNCRHMASRQSKAIVTQLVLMVGVGAVAATQYSKYTVLAAGLGQLGSGLLLANYSRSDERQADQWGQSYMVKSGYHPAGMAHLMERLVALNDREPGVMEVMFSSHPMSTERYDSAVLRSTTEYAGFQNQKTNRERYMDMTAGVRAQKDAIVAMQNGMDALGGKNVVEAERQFDTALKIQPQDYTGLLLMAKLKLAQERYDQAREYAARAKAAYPGEPQALHVAGLASLNTRQYEAALADFSAYDQRLPGNPVMAFFKGVTLDQLNRRDAAAAEYQRFLQSGATGEEADLATNRLTAWGYIKPPQPQQAPAPNPATQPAGNKKKNVSSVNARKAKKKKQQAR